MSKVAKGIKKAFKKVLKSKIFKAIVVAVAVYFTAGLILSAMPATASFAATMPGWGAGGMFSSAATSMGLGSLGASGSGLAATYAGASGAAAAGAGAATAATSTASSGAAAGGAAGTGASAAGAGGAVSATGATAVNTGASTVANLSATTAAANTSTAATVMSTTEKLLLAKAGVDLYAASQQPTAEEQAEAQRRAMQGPVWGINPDGSGPGTGAAPDVGGFVNITPPVGVPQIKPGTGSFGTRSAPPQSMPQQPTMTAQSGGNAFESEPQDLFPAGG